MSSSNETTNKPRRKKRPAKRAPKYSPRAIVILDKLKTAASRNTTGVNSELLDEATRLAFGVSAPKAPQLSTHTFGEAGKIKDIIDDVTDPKPPQTPSALPNDLLADILRNVQKSDADTSTKSVPSIPGKPLADSPPIVPVPSLIERRLNVVRLSNAVKNAIAGDQASLDKLVANDDFFLSLDFDAIKRAYAKGIKDSGDITAARNFVEKNFPRGGSIELLHTMEGMYGTDEPMNRALIDTPTSLAPSAEASRRVEARRAITMTSNPPPRAPIVPPSISGKGAGWTEKVREAWMREIDDGFNDARNGNSEKLDALVNNGTVSFDALVRMTKERLDKATSKDRVGWELITDYLKSEELAREADEEERQRLEAERTRRPPAQAGDRIMSKEEHDAMERSGKLDKALSSAINGDRTDLQRMISAKEFSASEINAAFERLKTLPGQSDEDASLWWNLQSWAAKQQELSDIPGVPEKGNIRRFSEAYTALPKLVRIFVGGILGGASAITIGPFLVGVASTTWLGALGLGAIRGTFGAAGAIKAGEKINAFFETTAAAWQQRNPKSAAVIKMLGVVIAGAIAGGLVNAVATGWDSLTSALSSKQPAELPYAGHDYGTPKPNVPSESPPVPAPAPVEPPIGKIAPIVPAEPAPITPAPPDIVSPSTPATPGTPGGESLPSVPEYTYTVGADSVVGKLGLWGSFTEELLRNKSSFLAQALDRVGIVLTPNLQESFAMAVNQVLYENPDLLRQLSPDIAIEKTADGFKSIVPSGAVFSGSNMEEVWQKLFDNESFYDKLSKMIESSDNYRSLGTALKVR